jgi:hypothetical protein
VANQPGATDLITAVSNALRRNGVGIRQTASPPASANGRQLSATIERQRKELQELQRSHDELTRKVDALEKRSKSLLGALDQLKDLPLQRLALQSQVQAARIQQVTGVVSNIQAAAFGETGKVFTRNNLVLAGNQLFWIFLDPVLRRFGVISGTSPSIVTWLAPVGSLLTGQLALANQQHVRFISGVATVTPGTVTFDILRDRIADGFWEEFQRRTDVAVTAVVLGQARLVAFAEVRQGVLRVGVTLPDVDPLLSPPAPPPVQPVRVAWIVDTGVASG